ncbi:hypothetical protein [Streptomyces violascens]|uniref:hypothetical protein n=1 Tax=Streptomyces violascens TaxID=67381 RepID=UPI003694D19C
MTTTVEIARAHGHTGPDVCHSCGTAANLHFASWAVPATGESGTFLECCGCGIAAGDPVELHDECEPDEVDEDLVEDEETGPEVRVFHRADGWTVQPPGPEPCTTNFHRRQDGRPPCTEPAVWKVVELDGLVGSIGFYCDADLPAEHKQADA